MTRQSKSALVLMMERKLDAYEAHMVSPDGPLTKLFQEILSEGSQPEGQRDGLPTLFDEPDA